MALLWMDGFEQYGDRFDLNRAYSIQTTSSLVGIVTGRNITAGNNQALYMDGTSFSGVRSFAESTSTVIIGYAFANLDSASSTNMVSLYHNGTEMITVRQENREIAVDIGSTEKGVTTTVGLIDQNWYHIECKVFIHDSTGTIELWVDGVKLIDLTSQDTRNGTPETVNRLVMWGHNGRPGFDDVFVLDDSGSDNTDVLGDCRVETLFPDADGNETDFTAFPVVANYLNVDDGSVQDDDTTYNHSAVATDRDLYGFAPIAGSVDTVYAVGVVLVVRKEEAGGRLIRTVARSNVTEVESGDLSLGTTWHHKHHIYEQDPDGGAVWDEAAVNAAEFGIEIQ